MRFFAPQKKQKKYERLSGCGFASDPAGELTRLSQAP